MTSHRENELLTRVGPGTSMGTLKASTLSWAIALHNV